MAPARYRSLTGSFTADVCGPVRSAAARGEVRLVALARGSYPGEPLRPGLLPQLLSVGEWDATGPQSWGLERHRNEGLELTYLASGSMPFATDAGSWVLQPGDLTVTRPWQAHQVGAPQVTPGRLQWAIIDVGVRRPDQPWRWPAWLLAGQGDRQALTDLLRGNPHPVWRADRDVASAFDRLADALAAGPARRERWLALRLNELLLAVTDLLERGDPVESRPRSSGEDAVRSFLARLPARLDERWTLDRMAGECGLGRTRFAHHCRRLTNRTPHQHLLACRIDCARELLTGSDLTVTAIAHAAGFASSQHLAGVLRRVTGRSPTDWRC
jgi:AraC family L-rhamnose operon regulatory protein RhaS